MDLKLTEEQEIKDLFECPVCFKIPASFFFTIFQCGNDHVLCTECLSKLNNCPVCGLQMAEVAIKISNEICENVFKKPDVLEKDVHSSMKKYIEHE